MMTRLFIPRNALITRWTAPLGILLPQPRFTVPRLNAPQRLPGVFSPFRTTLPQSLVSFTVLCKLRTLIAELQTLLFQASPKITPSTIPPKILLRTQTPTAPNLLLRRLSQTRNIIQKLPTVPRSTIDETSPTINATSTHETHLTQRNSPAQLTHDRYLKLKQFRQHAFGISWTALSLAFSLVFNPPDPRIVDVLSLDPS
jgi:hypothetical protein